MKRLAVAGLGLLLTTGIATAQETSEFFHDGVLGTSGYLRVDGTGEAASKVETAVLDEIERLRRILDRYDETSEFRRLPVGQPTEVSAELAEVLQACRTWRIETGGAFEPGIGALDAVWRRAETDEAMPDEASLKDAVRTMRSERWRVQGNVVTATEAAQSLDGLAKGYILDRAVDAAIAAGSKNVVLDIGGDILARGESIQVRIARPGKRADNGDPLTTIQLDNAAVATSGNSVRGYMIGGELQGHVLDPRTGQAVRHLLQVSVVAPSAMDADALATGLLVLEPRTGMDIVARMEGVECLMIDVDGVEHTSPNWPSLANALKEGPQGDPWPEAKHVHVDIAFERHADPEQRGKRRRSYRRPYIAVWVETTAGTPVRTLGLWIQRERWLRDLRQWYRYHKDNRPLIDAMSRPTRNPGEYSFVWDGLNDQGQALPLGEYVLVVEAAREHGTYQITRGTIDTRKDSGALELDSNIEITSARVHFGPSPEKDA